MEKRNGLPNYRIDDKVSYTMTGLILLSLLVLGFRYSNTEPCMNVNVVVKAPNYYQGALISFRAEAAGGKHYEWDFGDGESYESNLSSVQHSFGNPGIYIISVVVNGHCEDFDTVTITEPPIDKTVSLQPSFISPDSATVNRPVTLIDTTHDATSWKWRLGESDVVDGTERKISYTYKTPGVKLIWLEINGRRDRAATRAIYVVDEKPLVQPEMPRARPNRRGGIHREPIINDRPGGAPLGNGSGESNAVPQPPAPKIYPDVQADEVTLLLQGVVTGEKKSGDFTQYFCDETDIPVTYNGTPMKFSQMCNILRGYKKLKKIGRPEVQLSKNASSHCINRMVVNVKKKGFIDGLF